MGDGKERIQSPRTSRDALNELVSVVCEKEQLMETTVRDLLSNGWMYMDDRWIKHGRVVLDRLV